MCLVIYISSLTKGKSFVIDESFALLVFLLAFNAKLFRISFLHTF